MERDVIIDIGRHGAWLVGAIPRVYMCVFSPMFFLLCVPFLLLGLGSAGVVAPVVV